jgi:hypothetical protein
MAPDLPSMTDRLAGLREQVAHPGAGPALLAQVEDALTEGYACALSADDWTARAERRLHDLLTDTDVPVRARDLRELTTQHTRLQRELVALRRELAALWHDRDRLRTGARAAST